MSNTVGADVSVRPKIICKFIIGVKLILEDDIKIAIQNEDSILNKEYKDEIAELHEDNIEFNGCIFNNCKISGKLEAVTFFNCEFVNCDLSNTNFEVCNFKKSKFNNCKLTGCNFSDALINNVKFVKYLENWKR